MTNYPLSHFVTALLACRFGRCFCLRQRDTRTPSGEPRASFYLRLTAHFLPRPLGEVSPPKAVTERVTACGTQELPTSIKYEKLLCHMDRTKKPHNGRWFDRCAGHLVGNAAPGVPLNFDSVFLRTARMRFQRIYRTCPVNC